MRELGDLGAFLVQDFRRFRLHPSQILPHRLALDDAFHAPRSTARSATMLTKPASVTIPLVRRENLFADSVMNPLLNHDQPLAGRTHQLSTAASPPKSRGPKRCCDTVADTSSRFTRCLIFPGRNQLD